MEKLQSLSPLFTVTITFCAVFTALGLMFNILLGPIETRMDHMEARMDRMETRMDRMEARINSIEDKLDQIISSQKQASLRKPASP